MKVSNEEAHKIYHVFFWDWAAYGYNLWPHIIKSKDLGVECVDETVDHYEVVDQKKWMIAKIKYGI